MNILEISHLNAFYATQVLYDFSFSLREGEIYGIIGANGASKTTVLNAIIGLVKREGTILFDGVDISTLKTEKIIKKGIAMVPSDRGVFLEFSVRDNLILGAASRNITKSQLSQELDQRCEEFPELANRLSQQAGTLSGGEQEMLVIARALMLAPKLLLLDEPSLGLSPVMVNRIFAILREINQSSNLTVILVEENATLAFGFADTICLMETGKIIKQAPKDVMEKDTSVVSAYLGIEL